MLNLDFYFVLLLYFCENECVYVFLNGQFSCKNEEKTQTRILKKECFLPHKAITNGTDKNLVVRWHKLVKYGDKRQQCNS